MSSEEIKAEYTSSLADLTFNSKPLINVLTMLAEENLQNASDIVEAIETHLSKVHTDVKLPILYLIDCIVKNVGGTYTELFSQNVVSTFCSVFKVVDEKTRAEMFKLRQTWNDVFPQKKLYAIDVQINLLDPAWPVTAQPPSNSIHFNPKFLKTPNNAITAKVKNEKTGPGHDTLRMQQKLIEKQKELLELQQKKLELELLQTQVKLRESSSNIPVVPKDPRKAYANQNIAPSKKPMGIGASVMNHRQQNNSNVPRINPVGNALINASKRPINRDPRLQKQNNLSNQSENTPQNSKPDVTAPGKISMRPDPRLNNANKDAQSKDANSKSNKSPQKSRLEKSARSSSKSSSDSLKSSSNSSLDPEEKKNDKTAKSPTKSKRNKYEEKKMRPKKGPTEQTSPNTFKEGKLKDRIYARRNRSTSRSPDRLQDEDLRSFGPPEKQIRLQGDSTDEKSVNKDVDLRQLPPAIIGKKRPSTEALESSPAKKKKSEVFDILFGNEDTDLRKLPSVAKDRPPTPPPPIISSSDAKAVPEVIEIKSDSPPKKNNKLDAIRAKLANATNRDKIFAKSFHKKKLAAAEDQDLRVPHVSSTTDTTPQIIISPADEQSIKTGSMTKEQEKVFLSKILAQMEKNQLNEAKKKDHEESFGNMSMQTISDDELDDDYNSEEERERERFKKEVYGSNKEANDKDERVQPHHSEDVVTTYPKFREQRWQGAHWRGGRRRHWDNPLMQVGPHVMPPRPGMRPWLHPPGGPPPNWRHMGPPPRHPDFLPIPNNNDFAPSTTAEDDRKSPDGPSDLVVESVNQEDIKNISIDGIPRDIRYYDEAAIIFMNWDDPREISFQDGSRRVTFNDNESYVLSFNEPYKDVMVNGTMCKVRLGVPSREVYINNRPFECYFGGPGITIDLNGANTTVKLDGPPPQVKIGTVKRTDLVAGRVNLIINAKLIIPVFLDAKAQRFLLDGETHTLRFVDSLKTVLINDCPFNVEFGGLPKPVTIHGKKHFIRFSVLPRGVKPGYVRIKDMEGQVMSPPHVPADEGSRDGFEPYDAAAPAMPAVAGRRKLDSPERNSNSPQFLQNFLQQTNLDVLSSVLASSATQNSASCGYQVENVGPNADGQSNSQSEVPSKTGAPSSLSLPSLNINDLYQKLVATGIVTTSASEKPQPKVHTKFAQPAAVDTGVQQPPPVKRNPLEHLRVVSFARPETLKMRQSALYGVLYTGMQCSSCGMRFPPEQSIQYSQHLDWHFRQNRKGKRNIRVATSRRWYYSLSDWKNYEEIEDLEEREKNFFDQQATQADGASEEAEEEVEIPTVPAAPDITNDICEVCKDRFDQFFNEDKEEWHLRNAIRVEDKAYHPLCYEDYLQSLLEPSLDDSQLEKTAEEPTPKEELIPGLQIILDDDDDDESVAYNPEEVIIDESDEEEVKEEEKPADDKVEEDDGDDDDVILNEEAPVKIVVDDDDDNDDDVGTSLRDVIVKKEKVEIDDGFEDVGGLISLPNGGHIKIKAEPMDNGLAYLAPGPSNLDDLSALDLTDPEPSVSTDKDLDDVEIVTKEPAPVHTGFMSSIDGNVELNSGIPATAATSRGIKINISKPLAVIAPKETNRDASESESGLSDALIDPSQPLPPGEEPVQLNLKPALVGLELKKLPPVCKGTELSGLCSIM